MRTAEDDQRVAGDVCLLGNARGQESATGGFKRAAELERQYLRVLTTTRRPSHSAVLNACSFAGGLPGSTARIEMVDSGLGRSLRSKTRYNIARSKSIMPGSDQSRK